MKASFLIRQEARFYTWNAGQGWTSVPVAMTQTGYAQPCLYRGIDQAGEINEHPTALDDVRQATQALILS